MKKVVIAIILFMGGTLFSNAQESIKAIIKKCEKAGSVEMSYIINKDPETRKVQSSVTTIKIKDDPALVKEFIAAFEKEKDNAYSVSGSVKNGVSIPSSYKFLSGKDNYISCTISISTNNADASVSYRESPNKPGNISIVLDGEPFNFSGFGTNVNRKFLEPEDWFNGTWVEIEERRREFEEKKDQLLEEARKKMDESTQFDFEVENMQLSGGGVGIRVQKTAK